MTKKEQSTVCTNAWPLAQGEPLVEGATYNVKRRWFYNGEHWVKVERAGKITEAPSIFFA